MQFFGLNVQRVLLFVLDIHKVSCPVARRILNRTITSAAALNDDDADKDNDDDDDCVTCADVTARLMQFSSASLNSLEDDNDEDDVHWRL